jgi:hypothetical protein
MATSSEDPYEAEEHAVEEHNLEEQPKKEKKRINEPLDWIEVQRWNQSDHSDKDIKVFIRAELDALNRSAGIMDLPGAHKDQNNEYFDFQFRRNWITEKGQVENFLCACPLRERCNCKCEAKIAIHPTMTILYFSKQHTAQDHACELDKGKWCLEVFKPYSIGKQILESDRTVFLTFATPWNLLIFWRACWTGFGMQISGDVTIKASNTALNKLVFAVNRLGSHAVPLCQP